MELPYARAREGVTGNQHLARLSRCKRAHIRLLSAPRSERATTRARFRKAIVDRLDRALHRLRAGPLQGVLAGLRGLPGARTKKAHVGRNCTVSAADVGAWDGAVAVQQVLPGQSLARARVGPNRNFSRLRYLTLLADIKERWHIDDRLCVRQSRFASCMGKGCEHCRRPPSSPNGLFWTDVKRA